MPNLGIKKLIAIAGVASLALTGCAGGVGGELENGDEAEVTLGVFNGWDDNVAVAELWKVALEEEGYDVTLEFADPAAVFTGVANGDYDFMLAAADSTHRDYLAEYGDDMVEQGAWYTNVQDAIAVNADAPIDSLTELAEHADEFGNTIYGIEPGAGLTQKTQEAVIPDYGLEEMEYVLSSTPAMLTELQSAIDSGENVVVTLWHPHWAYDAFPIKDLEDPEGALGEAQNYHVYSSLDAPDSHPTLAGWFGEWQMEADQLHELMNQMFYENESDDYSQALADWMAENQDYVDSLTQ